MGGHECVLGVSFLHLYDFAIKFVGRCGTVFLPLLRRFNPAEPVVEKSVIL